MYFFCKGTPVNSSGLNSGASGSVTCGNLSLRNDLLVAADSVTNAMSSLVKELNSGKYIILHFIYLYFVQQKTCQSCSFPHATLPLKPI